MQQLPEALAPLDHYRQFILYKLVPKNDGTGKVDKAKKLWKEYQKINVEVLELENLKFNIKNLKN